ncbi:MAG TPA: glycosyltransferase [Solirubrobacteraceae bacterium]|nr:glycosyltransferase [Solirubrobacteraceae bacterium]
MALRLTSNSLTSDDARPDGGSVALRATGAFGATLAGKARPLLIAGDIDGYRALFTRAGEQEDPNARYHARVLLLEEGLTAAGQAPTATQAAQLFADVAKAGLDALDEQPSEPIILGYTGVALYELWGLDGARALFEAAQRLEPSLPHIEQNLAQLKDRRRHARRNGRPFHPTVPALVTRAKRIAVRAKPASGLTLSLCMIVRDEEEMLPRCLAAVAPAVDEIVIVDTGSVDRTVEIAHEFGAKVIHREWTGSFSDARNVSFEAATSDWLMYLDADEVLVAEDVKRLRALTGRIWKEAFYLVETSYTGDVEDGSAVTNSALRIFRNRPHYRFEGRLHEQIAHHLPTYAHNRIEQTSVRVEHFGYLGAVRDAKEKSTRNIDLLRAQQRESAPSAFLHFNIGTEYAVIGDHGSALIEFERAWEMARRQGEERRDYVPALMTRLVTALRLTGRQTEAVSKVEEGLELFPGFTDLVYAQALAYLSIDRQDEAIEAWKRCIEMGDAPARYGATVGAGTYLPKISLAELYLSRGELQQATELLDECITEYPGFVGVVGPYATALLAGGATPDAVVSEIEGRVAEVTLNVRFVLGTVLYARGAMFAAERQYREVLASRPTSSQVRVALAEALLHQRRYLDAAAEAAAVGGDDAFAPLAARIELWGALAGEDLAGAKTAQAKAAAAGVPTAQLEVFDAWASLLGPDRAPRQLPVAATPLFGAILETLLSAQDLKTFELLVGLIEHSALPEREQREMRASMYLRVGLLAPAAQEWMAICESAPDARALVGLARVSAAHGAAEDAVVFATEALNLEPTSEAARVILGRFAPTAAAA